MRRCIDEPEKNLTTKDTEVSKIFPGLHDFECLRGGFSFAAFVFFVVQMRN